MPKVVMYSTQICPYCMRAEHLLRNRGVEHIEKIMIDREPEKMQEMMQRTGRRTVPQVFIGDKHIGGFDDLSELDMEDGLVPLLEAN
ncbi:glutaredoxin 3 [Candidatus Albibeggiatoa sp. nov. NOAA]|uniref:glutaredoxin 3 n=1 Tax=Candidatus Albibeggiatoa sp. nov. NOAA TaxID=3162724 RepID=UPI0032F4743C|nr:glutaredoxin 3 [Thiotrichaceae bacterium]